MSNKDSTMIYTYYFLCEAQNKKQINVYNILYFTISNIYTAYQNN